MPGLDEEIESGRRIDRDFSAEEWRFKAKMISSDYKDQITTLINQYDFSQLCKIQLINVVNVAFDPNAMLARNPEIESRKIKLEIALNLATVAMTESMDTQNPGLINVKNAITDAFGDFVSPSIGGKERDRITKQETVTHSSYSGLPGDQQPQKRGFKLPWQREG